MAFKVVYEKRALKNLAKIDKGQQQLIVSWIEKNLIDTDNPRRQGKALQGSLKDYWRYRVGSYRILADINDEEVKIIIFNIQHRKDIYKN